MRTLAALLLFLPTLALAICATGTVEYWNFSDQSLVGDCNGKTFSASSPVYSNVGCSPATTFAPISFTPVMNMNVTDSSITTMASGSYSYEFYAYKYTRVPNSYALCFQTGAGTGQDNCIQIGDAVSDNVTVRTGGSTRVIYSHSGALGHCVFYAWVGTSTYGQLWMGVDGAAPTVVSGVASTDCRLTSSVDTLVLGTTAGFTTLSASLNGLRISNIVQPTFPTVDPSTPVRGQRSPVWYNRQRNMQSPQIFPRLR